MQLQRLSCQLQTINRRDYSGLRISTVSYTHLVVAINDLTSPNMLAHLLKYDSSQGKYELADKVSAGEDSITVDGKEIKIYAFPDANNCPWGELKVDVVLECSGFYTSKEKAQAHINAGARKVVISAPAGNDLPTIVYNTNHETCLLYTSRCV